MGLLDGLFGNKTIMKAATGKLVDAMYEEKLFLIGIRPNPDDTELGFSIDKYNEPVAVIRVSDLEQLQQAYTELQTLKNIAHAGNPTNEPAAAADDTAASAVN
jgi:hypothetical protein